MEKIKLELDKIYQFVDENEINKYKQEAEKSNLDLHNKTGKGNDFLGWVNLPSCTDGNLLNKIENTANRLKKEVDTVVVIGIGGSYLGAKSVIEALSHSFSYLQKNENPLVLFAGQNIGEDYLFELQEVLENRNYAIIVISKSGTTTEPAIAFRLLKKDLEEKYGKEIASNRIVAITDEKKGALRQLAEKEGYETFVIPDDVGGRYSVLTPVGLLPIAIAGFDIKQMIEGAKEMEKETSPEISFENNIASQYAAARNALYKRGKTTEILVNYNSKLQYISEWWKQLYGESEGKEGKGIFTASVNFTTDLHSLGQYIQDGERVLFETVISVEKQKHELRVPEDEEDLDKLNYLAGKRIDAVNKMAELGTQIAHLEGEVPNIRLIIPEINEYYLGNLLYFFEKACGISGYILGVNPFDQPGVEAYKRNMFSLLGKPK